MRTMRMVLTSSKVRSEVRCILAAVFALAFLLPVSGQSLDGSLVGTVTDSSGLAVPGATVTITQAETNQSREGTTSATGAYSFPNIATGTYQVDVTLPGFQTFRARGVVVQQNSAVRVDAKLSVGAIQETVLVSGSAAVLQTESAAVQSRTTSEQIENLPTSGRAFQSFMTLMPGVAQPTHPQAGGINNPARSMAISVNGQPTTNTVVRIDGANATNLWMQHLQSYSPGLEAIETVSMVTNSFDADQGMAGGASVNVQVKSGTNTLHGSAFEYLMDVSLKARNYFLPKGQDQGIDRKNVFGGTIGGPILRNRLFFFISDESELRNVVGGSVQQQIFGSGITSLPPADLRAGNFSSTGTVLYDPLTGNRTNGTGRTPFAFANCPGLTSTTDPGFAACNFIPSSRINPISRRLLDALVLPTQPGYANNYFILDSLKSSFHKIDAKLTWTPTNKLNMNFRTGNLPNTEHSRGILPSVDGAEFNPLQIGRKWDAITTSNSVTATSILSPTFVVDGVFGFMRARSLVGPDGPTDKCWGDEFGIPNACPRPYSLDRATPAFTMSGWNTLGNSPMRDYLFHVYQWSGNAGWTKGSHNVKFGADVIRNVMDIYETQVPAFVFSGGATALNGGASPNNFNTFADFLLGLPNQRSSNQMTPVLNTDNGADNERPGTLRFWQHGLYVRDQWQINRKITAAIGVRWEYYPLQTRADRGLEMFDFTTNRMQICGVAGADERVCDIKIQKNLFTPRLGLAYRPTETSVIRVGFSRNPQNDNIAKDMILVFPAQIRIDQTGPNSFTPVGTLSDGVPLIQPVDLAEGSLVLPPGAGVARALRDRYIRGTITSWNVSVQKLFPYEFNVQVGYVANRQNGLTRAENLNYGTIGGGTASQPFNQPGLASGFRTTAVMNEYLSNGHVTYDSLQLSLSRRMADGLQFQSQYTYAKAIDSWAGTIPIPEYYHLNKGVQGGADSSSPHKTSTSAVYQLPFGAGKKFLNEGGILGNVVGGWQVSAFFTAYSGMPFTVTASAASLNAPGSPQLADQVKDTVEILGGVGPTTPYFDVLAFKPVTEARFGTSKFNGLRGPGVANLDMTLTRTITTNQTINLQLKVEVFNVTNTPHFANPGANVSNLQLNPDGTVRNLNGFGVITATNKGSREFDERHFRLGIRMAF